MIKNLTNDTVNLYHPCAAETGTPTPGRPAAPRVSLKSDADWVDEAVSRGFTRAGWIDVPALTFEDAHTFRGFCEKNDCGTYGACWTCPPGVGGVDAVVGRLRAYGRALLVQHEEMADVKDGGAVGRVRTRFKGLMDGFLPEVRKAFPGVLPLGSGGCKICAVCAYPGAPCVHPDKMIESVSAYCINARQACDLANLPCWRDGFVAFTGMFFINAGA